jgi:hypothetical protein
MKNTEEINYSKLSYYRTSVSIYKTQDKIRQVLERFGLKGIRFAEYDNNVAIEFILEKNDQELAFRFAFPMPEKDMYRRQVWRGFYHYIKNRFMAIEFGISTIEEEFLQEMVLKLPNGQERTVKDIVKDQLGTLQYESKLNLPFKKKSHESEN